MSEPALTGLLAPLWTFRSQKDLGIGDLAALEEMLPWFQEAGLNFVQLTPINYADQSNSPYSAISSIALDPIYLNLARLSGDISSEVTQNNEAGSPDPSRVDYETVRPLKERLLRQAYEVFSAEKGDRSSFLTFCRENEGWLEDFALFRACMDLAGGSAAWDEWDCAYNTPEKARAYARQHDLSNELDYLKWQQWHCFTQWKAVRARADALGIGLMGDIPIGVSYQSADVFFEREHFETNWFGGAPPETHFEDDAFAVKWGQNWGVPLYDEQHMQKTDYAWWRRRIAKHTEIFSLFRIDHILGLYRIYAFPWPPRDNEQFLLLSEEEAAQKTGGALPQFQPHGDDTPEQSAANLARGDRLLSVLIEAAGDAEIIAEDLGYTPDYVRGHLESRRVAGFRICQWEASATLEQREEGATTGSMTPSRTTPLRRTPPMTTLRSPHSGMRPLLRQRRGSALTSKPFCTAQVSLLTPHPPYIRSSLSGA